MIQCKYKTNPPTLSGNNADKERDEIKKEIEQEFTTALEKHETEKLTINSNLLKYDCQIMTTLKKILKIISLEQQKFPINEKTLKINNQGIFIHNQTGTTHTTNLNQKQPWT